MSRLQYTQYNDPGTLMQAEREGLLPRPHTILRRVYQDSLEPHHYAPNLRVFDVTIAKQPEPSPDRGPGRFQFTVIAYSFPEAAQVAVDRANAWRATYLKANELNVVREGEGFLDIAEFTVEDVVKMETVREQVTVGGTIGAVEGQLRLPLE